MQFTKTTKYCMYYVGEQQQHKIFKFIFINIVRYITMPIKRKVRMCGESLAVTIPSQIAQLHDIKEGDYLEFTPIGYGEFKIKKIRE